MPLHRRRSGSASPQSARASPTSSAPRRATRGARSARRSSPRARCASPRRARSSPRSSANLIVSSCSRGSCSRSSAGTRWVIPTRSTTSSATSLTRSSSATVPGSWNLLRARRSWCLRMLTKKRIRAREASAASPPRCIPSDVYRGQLSVSPALSAHTHVTRTGHLAHREHSWSMVVTYYPCGISRFKAPNNY